MNKLGRIAPQVDWLREMKVNDQKISAADQLWLAALADRYKADREIYLNEPPYGYHSPSCTGAGGRGEWLGHLTFVIRECALWSMDG